MSVIDLISQYGASAIDLAVQHGKDVTAFGGVALNLVLNVFNLRRTNKLRSDTLRLEEFKRLRVPVDTAYAAIKEHRATLKSLEASGGAATKVRKSISDCNKELSNTFNSLCDALADLDRSTLVSGKAWVLGVPEAWDQIAEAFDRAYVKEKDLAALKEVIRKIIIKIDDLLTLVLGKLDAEINKK
ncbi:hypothetical protein JQ612_12990 [Bradyrhizobium manausense]|uniref:hypothetical protein n=1 Tax=Bradyrhizobium manausense TaxID=989370 RepID=UPI001BA58900|nr:hypothetical protein [Bradyrhizobium manausense]MBR0834109.1 hypothetical protein [Bradyrhizobium manausense]